MLTCWNKNKPFRVHIGADKEVSVKWERWTIVSEDCTDTHSLRRGTINVSGLHALNFVVKLNAIKARNLKNIEVLRYHPPRVTLLLGGRKFDTSTIEDTGTVFEES